MGSRTLFRDNGIELERHQRKEGLYIIKIIDISACVSLVFLTNLRDSIDAEILRTTKNESNEDVK